MPFVGDFSWSEDSCLCLDSKCSSVVLKLGTEIKCKAEATECELNSLAFPLIQGSVAPHLFLFPDLSHKVTFLSKNLRSKL